MCYMVGNRCGRQLDAEHRVSHQARDWCQTGKNNDNNDSEIADASQVNSFTHLRALLVLHGRGIWSPVKTLSVAGTARCLQFSEH
jgi:hypothetical protein